MQPIKFLHKTLKNALPDIHEKRVTGLTEATHALSLSKQLCLTQIGRASHPRATERSNIRKIDRLLGNEKLHAELPDIYRALNELLLLNVSCPVVSVDWSATDKRKQWHILRASVSVKGRAHTIYQEVHYYTKVNNDNVHKLFLSRLKQALPKNAHPSCILILTDAGFCNPWFKTCERLGFDWLGRTKATVVYSGDEGKSWNHCSDLYKTSREKPRDIGDVILTKRNQIHCRIITVAEKIKGRINKTRGGKKCESSSSKRIAARQRTPWVLVTSLSQEKFNATQIVTLYKKRMQIEEDFRDTKSTRYGFGLRYCLSKSAARIQVLLMLATLASFLCWLLAINAHTTKRHLDFQANSIKHKIILSPIYLGCQLIRRKTSILYKDILRALAALRNYINQVQYA